MNREAFHRRTSDTTTARESDDSDYGDRQPGSTLQPSGSSEDPLDTTYTLEGFNCPFVNERPITFVKPLSWVRVCVRCTVVAADTVLLPCGHTLCDWCLDDISDCGANPARWEGGSFEDRPRDGSCPLDSEPFVETDLVVLDFPVPHLLKLPVRCFHADLGCPFVGKLGELQHHLRECLFRTETFVLMPRCW
ncbi:TNF receptor-associated factor 6-like [Dermacentor variabilis]|uniref:TNF receptor-associated factor 6-like n=1 Tax=Dermacentor variabilis TaxID=34621 RepID=UPI003F5B8FD3